MSRRVRRREAARGPIARRVAASGAGRASPREQPEERPKGGGRRAKGEEEADERPLGPLPLLALRVEPPGRQPVDQRRRGEEEGFQDLGTLDDRAQARAQELAVGYPIPWKAFAPGLDL